MYRSTLTYLPVCLSIFNPSFYLSLIYLSVLNLSVCLSLGITPPPLIETKQDLHNNESHTKDSFPSLF